MSKILAEIELNEDRYLQLLANLIGESRHLQNNPAQGLIPREDCASDHVLRILEPYSVANGGPLEIERVTFVEGRGNVIIKYPGKTDKIVSFVGSHLDVVPANPSQWERDPFSLSRDGDLLYGRGTTDCLGHVALVTDFFATLGDLRPELNTSIVAVLIANEENGSFRGIGVDQLSKEGYLDTLKAGPVYWIDAADSHPCQGTCGVIPWKIECHGRLFHSGLPHKAINSIEMATDVLNYIQSKFYAEFPRDPREDTYNFRTCSTLKPTQISCPEGSLNQIQPLCTIQGDIRLAPFYQIADACEAMKRWVAEINADPQGTLGGMFNHGPHSKYVLEEENLRGSVTLTLFEGENGIAVDLSSPGYKALVAATQEILGEVKPYSIGGSLPLVRSMQEDGFDLQIAGYGLSSRYHADNECASLTDMKRAMRIFAKMDSLDSISLSKISWILHCNSDAAVSYSIFAPMAQGGFGMCGHKNYYSSSVRYGNWNEDRYGTEILTKREVPPLNYETEYTSNHRDPKTVSIDPKVLSVKLESLDELRAKNKEGLTYGLIFKHGEQDEPPQERFSTTLQQANERFKNYAVPDHTLAARREKLLSREMLELTSLTTESRKASMRLNTPAASRVDSGTKLIDILQPEPLPRWNRRKTTKL